MVASSRHHLCQLYRVASPQLPAPQSMPRRIHSPQRFCPALVMHPPYSPFLSLIASRQLPSSYPAPFLFHILRMSPPNWLSCCCSTNSSKPSGKGSWMTCEGNNKDNCKKQGCCCSRNKLPWNLKPRERQRNGNMRQICNTKLYKPEPIKWHKMSLSQTPL